MSEGFKAWKAWCATQHDLDVSTAYDDWKAAYLKPSTGGTPGGGYYVEMWTGGGPSDGKTTSEATGYGMIITALMAGYDASAQTYFDGLFNMYDNHRSIGDADLMSWIISNDELAANDSNSATDGDLDIAYALLLANQQWGSAGAVDYQTEALRILNSGVATSEISASSYRTLLGDWDTDPHPTRPSDWMVGHFDVFETATGDPLWGLVRNEAFKMTVTLQANHAPATGLVPDFVVNDPPEPAWPNFLEAPTDGDYSWNACRVPWRLTVDWAHNQSAESLLTLQTISGWIDTDTSGDPTLVRAGYALDGTELVNYGSLAFASPMVAASIVDASHQTFLDNGWTMMSTTREGYYEDSINLMSMLIVSGNWWEP